MDFHMVELFFFFWGGLVEENHEAVLKGMTQRTHWRRLSWLRRMASMVGSFLGGPGRCGTKQDPGL